MSGQQHAPATLHPRKDPVPILQEAGWAPGSVWTGGKSHHHRDLILDRPAHSQLLYRLSYLAHTLILVVVAQSHDHESPLGSWQNTKFSNC